MAERASRDDERGAPPFATPTLARLYLAQGHLGRAADVLRRVRAERGDDDAGWQAAARALDEALARQEQVLRDLLDRVRQRRRERPATPPGEA